MYGDAWVWRMRGAGVAKPTRDRRNPGAYEARRCRVHVALVSHACRAYGAYVARTRRFAGANPPLPLENPRSSQPESTDRHAVRILIRRTATGTLCRCLLLRDPIWNCCFS